MAFPMGMDMDCCDVEVDKLTYQIFSILENKFLFGSNNAINPTPPNLKSAAGKVRVLSIDGRGSTDGILAAKSLAHLESCLCRKSGNPTASIADYFDVAAGSGMGGILAALLFTRGRDGSPLFSAEGALKFLTENSRKISRSPASGIFRRRPKAAAQKLLGGVFGECTLKDTLKPVLIPCYDLNTRAPFLFSRADALEMDGYDFRMRDVCAATAADPSKAGPTAVKSIDGRTTISAVDGGIAMNNPTAAAITHVLNNKQEFPTCEGVENLLVLSVGNGETEHGNPKLRAAEFMRIAGDGASDMVDQAVSMAFGGWRASNYVRIQGNGMMGISDQKWGKTKSDLVGIAEEMLAQKNVESVLFKGKKMADNTNIEKLEWFCGEILTEQQARKTSILPAVVLKQASPSPRSSSATSLSTLSSS